MRAVMSSCGSLLGSATSDDMQPAVHLDVQHVCKRGDRRRALHFRVLVSLCQLACFTCLQACRAPLSQHRVAGNQHQAGPT